MADIATLGLEVDSKGVVKATKDLKKLDSQSGKTEKGNKNLTGSFNILAGAVTAFASSLAIGKFVETAGAFQSMAISLEVVTGSAEKATQAMEGIREFAKNTPFQVSEIADAFIKLKALGIDPSEESLRSFGDTASAMGKSLNQFIEAVADAATGEFERLKEFGIKARSQGDDVAFTFQGVTTTVKKNSEEITGYLESIGKTQFAGAMSKQMDTINGKISTLGDAFDDLIVTFSEAGGGSSTTGALDLMVDAVTALTDGVEMLPGIFVALFAEFDKMTTQISFGARSLKEELTGLFDGDEETLERRNALNAELEREIQLINDSATAFIMAEERKREVTGGAEGITLAGATEVDPLAAKEEALDAEFELASNHTDRMLRLIEMEDEARAEQINRDKKTAKDREKVQGAMMNNLVNLMNSGSKKMFEIGKAAAITQATIDTYKGAQAAFADTPGPIWVKAVAGVAALAMGLQRVSAISSTSFNSKGGAGGGGGAATVASTTGGQPVTGQLPPPAEVPGDRRETQTVSITLNGAGYSKENVRELIEQMNEEIGDGAELMVTG